LLCDKKNIGSKILQKNVSGLKNQLTDTLNKKSVHGCLFFSRCSRVQGSGVKGSILVPGLNLIRVITRKASFSSGLIQNLKLNWQLLVKMNLCNEGFGSAMPSLSLTFNVEP
jgi:hypothetical protein